MAIVLLNQTPYRRNYSSCDHINEQLEREHPRSRNARYPGNTRRPKHAREDFRKCPHFQNDPIHACSLGLCERVSINVSGQHYETWESILNRHPDTLLGDVEKRTVYFDERRRELFFDRHRPTFDAIFNYYQYGGKLRRPDAVPEDIFLTELEFFEIETGVIDRYKRDAGHIAKEIVMPEKGVRKRLWLLFEYPETSCSAYLVAIVSCVMTIVSIVLFCIETLPEYSKSHCLAGESPNFLDAFFLIETICTTWFSIEIIIRVLTCPSKLAFLKDFKNIVDVLAVAPYYVTLSTVLYTMSCENAKSSASLAFLRVIRLIRVFKLTKHSSGLQVLILTFQASLQGLGMFFIAVVVCVLVYSSAIYYAEHGNPESQIGSIPDGFWWAIITMTTVGYGDRVPLGPLGKIIGSLCAVSGVLTLAIPVPIITENFNKFYAHKTGRGKI